MKPVLSATLAALAFCGCAAPPAQMCAGTSRYTILHYSDFSRYLELRENAPVSAIRFQRNSTGAKLFVSYFFRKLDKPQHRTLIVTESGMTERPGYPRVWYDDQDNPVFRLEGATQWYEGEGRSERFFSRFENARYVFKNGPAIPIGQISEIEGVTGGDFVLLRFRPEFNWIVSRPDMPRRPVIELPKGFEHLQPAYAVADDLIVFGVRRRTGTETVAQCHIYQRAETHYHLAQEISIPWAGMVYDLCPLTGDALVSGTATKFTGYYDFNIRTKKRTRLAGAADESMFLKEGVIRVLDDAMPHRKST